MALHLFFLTPLVLLASCRLCTQSPRLDFRLSLHLPSQPGSADAGLWAGRFWVCVFSLFKYDLCVAALRLKFLAGRSWSEARVPIQQGRSRGAGQVQDPPALGGLPVRCAPLVSLHCSQVAV